MSLTRLAHEHERAVEPFQGHRKVFGAAVLKRAVHVDARVDATVHAHGLGRGDASGRVAVHSDPVQVERFAQPTGQTASLGIGVAAGLQHGKRPTPGQGAEFPCEDPTDGTVTFATKQLSTSVEIALFSSGPHASWVLSMKQIQIGR